MTTAPRSKLWRNLEQLAQISGVGRRKLDAYGTDFLEVILGHEYDEQAPLHSAANTEMV